MHASSSIAALVVVFYPDAEVFCRLERIRSEVGRMVVVDNGASSEMRATLTAWAVEHEVSLIINEENLGQARALNQGLVWAEEWGYEWVATFDQDSTPEPGFISALLASADRAKGEGAKVAVIGAHTFDERTGRRDRWLRPAWHGFRRDYCGPEDLAGVTFVITSGALTSVRAWRELGGFDEGLFIDYVDHNFCLQARRAGWEIRVSAAARLAHNLGAHREVQVAGRTIRPTFHGAIRHYYMARNRVLMWRRLAWRDPHWWLFDLCFGGLNALRVLLAEDARPAKFRAMWLGTWHGCLGRRGPCPENLRESLAP